MRASPRPADFVHAYAGRTLAQVAGPAGGESTTLCGLDAGGRAMRTRAAFLEESRRPRCPGCAARLPGNESLDQMVEGAGR